MRCNSREIVERLVNQGWRTPNCYSNHYATVPRRAGVYLFAVFDDFAKSPLIAYVGKSVALSQRLSGHEVLRCIRTEAPEAYVQTWFKTLPAAEIGAAEVVTIKAFNPPYNLQHRVKGLAHGSH